MWMYDMMNVQQVWEQNITGKGVMIRVNDPTGVDVTIDELRPNFVLEASCQDRYLPPYDLLLSLESDEQYNHMELPPLNHGTQVASVALGVANNSHCAVGIAYEASLSACVGPLASTETADAEIASFFLDGLETTHISVNSWGLDACDRIDILDDNNDDLIVDDEGDDFLERKYNNNNQRRLQLEQNKCPFVYDVLENPCNLPICQESINHPICQEYIILYCSTHYEFETVACAEFLDLFINCHFNVLSDVGRQALTKGITEGRNGKGIIYVFAAGYVRDVTKAKRNNNIFSNLFCYFFCTQK